MRMAVARLESMNDKDNTDENTYRQEEIIDKQLHIGTAEIAKKLGRQVQEEREVYLFNMLKFVIFWSYQGENR